MGRVARGLQPRRNGRLPEKEKLAIALVHELNPEATAAQIAKILGRRTAAISSYIRSAEEILQMHAPWYAAQHIKATAVAAASGNANPAQWALERLSARDETGAEVRVIEREPSQTALPAGLTVNVGLAIGNIPCAIPASSVSTSLLPEVVSVPVSDSKDEG